MFRIKVKKNNVSVTEKDQMTAGSVNVYPVIFEFSSDWDGLDRIALFKNATKTIRFLLDDTNSVQMPWELMTEVGSKISVGVKGIRGNEVILPSVWAACGQVIESVNDAEGEPPNLTPSGTTMDGLLVEMEGLKQTIPDPMSADTLRDILTGGDQNG